MDLLALPPELLAAALNLTDGHTVINLLCTAPEVCRHVRALRDAIHLEHPAGVFVRGLPRIAGLWRAHAVDTRAFTTEGPGRTTRHVLDGPGVIRFPLVPERFTSIRCPTSVRRFTVKVGGLEFLRCGGDLLPLLDQGDGYFEAMAFLKHLPCVEWFYVEIFYHSGPRPADLYTTLVPSRHWEHRARPTRWQIVQLQDLEDATTFAETLLFRLFPSHVSLGFVVSIEHEGRLVTDLARTFTLGIAGGSPPAHHVVAAPALRCHALPPALFSFPGSLRDCYYIPMDGRIDTCVLEAVSLRVDLCRPATITTRVWHVHANGACALMGMVGLDRAS